ncbi:Retrovirus-related Pol polyprotein from transposon TNT 1-94 [Dendrobium catenatum]|uniref:Retrovirus-related Pol polyprotein from transposon TNT 1-94 n=1 Tax=Dendrobium catenatum TaxID=906689 RepID=A0A2I0WXH2_9ASPA|nr:Retrovirus-related Pol polyprotein from transposon TNT 1-94 [Dendrobium catenatum]
MTTRFRSGHLQPKRIFDLQTSIVPVTPSCYSEAVKHAVWRKAMSLEFEALQQQGTWVLVPSSPGLNVLGNKWIFRTKYNSDGSLAQYKARLVAKGFHQEFGIDYFDTFSPVAKFPTIRILFTVAISRNWPILQLDVSIAFLHGHLEETVYMKQPQGFVDSNYPDHVCLLKKAIYGLKQAPRQWFATFTSFLTDFNFRISTADPSLLLFSKAATQLYILVYVDDILLTGNDPSVLHSLLEVLHSRFHMRNLGNVSNFLGIQVIPISSGLHLSQTQYAENLLIKAGMKDCKPVQTPLPTKLPQLTDSADLFAQPELYRQLVGSLQYLTITRPDMSFAVNFLCQHMHKPHVFHFQLLKRVLRYLRGTLQLGLPILSSSLELQAYSDSDWASDTTTRRSVTGYCAYLGTNLVSWCVKKQTTVARSSTEAEYRALAAAASDVIWLRRLLTEFQVETSSPTTLFCDNVSAIALANNPVFHARTKHIEVDFHYIRDCIKLKHIVVHHVASVDQTADIFTKALPAARFQSLCTKLTLKETTVNLRGGDK